MLRVWEKRIAQEPSGEFVIIVKTGVAAIVGIVCSVVTLPAGFGTIKET